MEDPFENQKSPETITTAPFQSLSFIERRGIPPFLFALFSLVIIFFLYQIVGGIITLITFGYKPTPDNVIGFRIVTGLGQLMFILVPTFFLVRLVSHHPMEFLRLKMPAFQPLLISIIGIFSLQQMLQVYLIFQEKIPLPSELQTLIRQFKQIFEDMYRFLVGTNSVPDLLFVILVVALIPAIAEEFLFRGLIQRTFEKGVSPLRSAVLTGIIFGAYHLNPFSFVPLAIIGIYLGFLTMRTGSVWVSVVAHFFNNFLACIALFFNIGDDNVVFGGASTMPVGTLLLTFWFFGVVFLISMYYFLKVTKQVSVLVVTGVNHP